MIDLTVETAGVRDAQYVAAATPVPAAAERLRDPDVEILVVRDDDRAVLGVVTESDVVALVAETDDLGTVARCMSSPAVTIRPTATVREAAARMCRDGVKHLPVVDEARRVPRRRLPGRRSRRRTARAGRSPSSGTTTRSPSTRRTLLASPPATDFLGRNYGTQWPLPADDLGVTQSDGGRTYRLCESGWVDMDEYCP